VYAASTPRQAFTNSRQRQPNSTAEMLLACYHNFPARCRPVNAGGAPIAIGTHAHSLVCWNPGSRGDRRLLCLPW
jgi:hypothetical protein